MAKPGKAKAGRLGSGDNGLETDGPGPADETARAGPAEALPFELGMNGHDSDPASQIRAHLDQFALPQPTQFSPLEALKSRLGEFQKAAGSDDPSFSAAPEEAIPEGVVSSEPYRTDLAWFEKRFGELRHLLTSQEDGKRELAAINGKLAGITSRLDQLSTQMPNTGALAAAEERLASLARSLGQIREDVSSSGRISRAAEEILAACNSIQEERLRFETAAQDTLEELGKTVVATASRAAVLTAGEMSAALAGSGSQDRLARLENEMRALQAQSKESAETSATALGQVNESLRILAEKTPGGLATPARKRPSVHHPIYANSSIYNISGLGFGVGIPQKHQLGTITLRKPIPSDPNFIKALQEAEAGLNKPRANGPRAGATETNEPEPSYPRPAPARDDEKNPVSGIALVAIVLLFASAAIFYLNTRTHRVPFRVPAASQEKTLPDRRALASASDAAKASGDGEPLAVTFSTPSLFASSPEFRIGAPAEESSLAEDLKILEAAARHGDREAQFRIGKRFLNDGELEGGAATAARWLSRAAEQGHIEAMFMLASLYERGAGVSKDEDRALTLYRKAAASGYVRAMHNLGAMLSARGSAAGYREAALWFNRAALAGLSDSQYNLALLYERGLGVEQDLARAYFWYKVASNSGDKEACQQAERLKKLMPPGETAAAGAEAGSWHPMLEDNARSAWGKSAHRG